MSLLGNLLTTPNFWVLKLKYFPSFLPSFPPFHILSLSPFLILSILLSLHFFFSFSFLHPPLFHLLPVSPLPLRRLLPIALSHFLFSPPSSTPNPSIPLPSLAHIKLLFGGGEINRKIYHSHSSTT